MWSLLPPFYTILFALARDFTDVRLNVMAVIITMWGARLTFNFWYATFACSFESIKVSVLGGCARTPLLVLL